MSKRSLLCCCKKDTDDGGGGGTPCLECQNPPPNLTPCGIFGHIFITKTESEEILDDTSRCPPPLVLLTEIWAYTPGCLTTATQVAAGCYWDGRYYDAGCAYVDFGYPDFYDGCRTVNRSDIYGFNRYGPGTSYEFGPRKPTGTYRTIYVGRKRLPWLVMNEESGAWSCDEYTGRILGTIKTQECIDYDTFEEKQFQSRIWGSTRVICAAAEKRRECCNSAGPSISFSLPDQGYWVNGVPYEPYGGIVIPAHDVILEGGVCFGWATNPETSCCCNPPPDCVNWG